MYSNLAKINGESMVTGVGQALYDNPENPTKRYFLEKRWKSEGDVLGVIMTNPSKAGALESDKTVEALMKMAKRGDYAALYIVNIIPYIASSSKKLKNPDLGLEMMIAEDMQIKSFELLFKNSSRILLAWGSTGQRQLPILIKAKRIRELFERNKAKCCVVGYGKKDSFPYHPLPQGFNKYKLSEVNLIDASEKVEEWVNKYK